MYGIGFAVGLIVMLSSFETIHWYNYMRASPQVGSISGGGVSLSYLLFAVGAVIAFSALLSGLQRAIYSEVEG